MIKKLRGSRGHAAFVTLLYKSNKNTGRKPNMKTKRMTAAAAALMLAASVMQAQTAFASTHEEFTDIALETGAPRSSEFVSVNVPITVDGKELRLVATGLTEDNKDAFVKAIEDNYSLDDNTPLYIHDDAFVDSEKFDTSIPFNDSGLCWASSCSNILWLTDWAQNYSDPLTGKAFTSEDDLFDLYTESFINKGAVTDAGIEWFFNNLFFMSGAGNHTFPLNQDNPALGVEKGFVASRIIDVYDVTNDSSAISKLLDLDRESENACGAGLAIGNASDENIEMSTHALTAEGIIYDPNEQDLASRYKAIILIDSDNDADAEFELDTEAPLDREKIHDCKSARPNSYTVYDLNNKTLGDGHNVWEIVGYGSDPTYPYIIYDIISLPLYDPELIAENTETEGTKQSSENVDLVIDYMFTTNRSEPMMLPYKEMVENDATRYFGQSDEINLNVFIGNKAGAPLTEDYADGNTITFDYTVTNKADGSVVSTGSEKLSGDIYNNSETAFLLHLNSKDGKTEEWAPGDYTVTLTINADRAITESYYLNNEDESFDFTILRNAIEPETPADSEEEPEDSTPADTETENDSGSQSAPVTTSNPVTGATAGALALAAAGISAAVISKKNRKQ